MDDRSFDRIMEKVKTVADLALQETTTIKQLHQLIGDLSQRCDKAHNEFKKFQDQDFFQFKVVIIGLSALNFLLLLLILLLLINSK